MKPFKSRANAELAKISIIEEAKALAPSHSEPEAAPSPETQEKKTGFWAHYEEVFGAGNQEESVSTSDNRPNEIERDFLSYLTEQNVSPKRGEKIGEVWAGKNINKYLSHIAHKYLCIPPCTVFSERMFSVAGNICDTKRNRLDPERVKILVFLNKQKLRLSN